MSTKQDEALEDLKEYIAELPYIEDYDDRLFLIAGIKNMLKWDKDPRPLAHKLTREHLEMGFTEIKRLCCVSKSQLRRCFKSKSISVNTAKKIVIGLLYGKK